MMTATATGRFRVYLGMAAGVGKTFAMLDEGHRVAASGCDVVVGLVTTHDRPETEKQLQGLEVVPRKVVHYHGARFDGGGCAHDRAGGAGAAGQVEGLGGRDGSQ